MVLMTMATSVVAQSGAPLSKHPIYDMLSGYDHGEADAKEEQVLIVTK